jgi:uncharacterized protein
MGPIALLVAGLLPWSPALLAQNDGDQFLDGIGETALTSRYLFNGNIQDRSRNSHHATLRGGAPVYVDDLQFGKVLSLTGEGNYLEIPRDALIGLDTISVTGWVFVRSATPWQRFFDFGKNTTANFFCTPIGEGDAEGYRARISVSGWEEEQGPLSPQVTTNAWTHLAIVLDATRKTLSTYRDGLRVGHTSNVTVNLEQVLDQSSAAANHLYFGRSQYDTDPELDAKLHDVRIYSIALSDQQVATIHNNARSGQQTTASNRTSLVETRDSEINTPTNTSSITLLSVPDIAVATIQGDLPRLPTVISALYREGKAGPKVRVIWPSPTNNSQVIDAGTYSITGRVAGTEFQPKAVVTVRKATASATPRRSLEPFPLGQVVLNPDEKKRETQFIKNRDKFVRTLADSNPDRFLYMFRETFGQAQPEGAQPLRGWDNQTTRLRGHATGHYLSAIAQAYASSTYDENLRTNFLQKMNYTIETLYDLSQKSGKATNEGGTFVSDPTAVPPGPGKTGYDSDLTDKGLRTDYWNWGKGFISAYPPDQFIMLEKGASYGGRNDQIWAPYYTLHKILAGLLDCYEVGGNRKALQIAQDMGLWVQQRLKLLPTATRISMWNRYIAGEYGGMNEAMARLFRLTHDERFLEGAKLFDNINFFFGDAQHSHGLAHNVDTLRGKHANQHIPQITGALETYRNSQDPTYYHIADNFWDICTSGYMYSIGGVAGARNPNNAECFTAQPNTLVANGFANGGQNETCATYNLLKLSRELFLFNQDAKYMDYYEQALYNHILASVAENNAGNTYHVPLNPGARKQFGNARMDGFTCCNGTALESSTKLQDSIYFRSPNNDALFVNLYVPSTLTWKEKQVTVKQQTNFPYDDTTRLTLNGSGTFDLKVRVPSWSTSAFTVKINGESQAVKAVPGTYLSLHRNWKDNDRIELRMPFDFHLSPVMDQPGIASVFYGPVLLAAQESEARSTWRSLMLDPAQPGRSITGDPGSLRFNIGDVSLKPFYESYDRYSVYFDLTSK